MTTKTMTVNKLTSENLTFALEISKAGNAFIGTMVAIGGSYHGVSYQAKTEEELRDDFEYFKSGFLRLNSLLKKGIERCVPDELAITFKEARIMAGIHPAILAERTGISLSYLKKLENGEAKRSLSYGEAFNHYRSTFVEGMKMDFIDWHNERQKKPLHSAK